MKRRFGVAVAAIVAVAAMGSLSSVWGAPNQAPRKKDPVQQPTPVPPEARPQRPGSAPGEIEAAPLLDHMNVVMQVDSMMQRMTALMEKTKVYSKSFSKLAVDHHGADKKEILMMQRMSDSMGMMAREVRASLQQYKEMLEDETASESGSMKAEVYRFKGILDGIARDLEDAGSTLEMLQGRLGQG